MRRREDMKEKASLGKRDDNESVAGCSAWDKLHCYCWSGWLMEWLEEYFESCFGFWVRQHMEIKVRRIRVDNSNASPPETDVCPTGEWEKFPLMIKRRRKLTHSRCALGEDVFSAIASCSVPHERPLSCSLESEMRCWAAKGPPAEHHWDQSSRNVL